MKPKKPPRTPPLRHHKGSGQGFVELDGRRIYLGRFDKPETRERYHRTIAEWESNGRRVIDAGNDLTVAELLAEYWTFAVSYYLDLDGGPSNEQWSLRAAFRPLAELYGSTLAREFGPRRFKTVRDRFIGNRSRKYVNQSMQRVKRLTLS